MLFQSFEAPSSCSTLKNQQNMAKMWQKMKKSLVVLALKVLNPFLDESMSLQKLGTQSITKYNIRKSAK